jgi:glycosyltransferase involved in cell wall biosynthesis
MLLPTLAVVFLLFTTANRILLLSSIVLLVSHGRALKNRYGIERQTKVLVRTWKRLSLILVGISLIYTVGELFQLVVWTNIGLLIILIVASRALILSIHRVTSYRYRSSSSPKTDLPTVTIAIPARNETHALTDTLRAAVANNYPKLEILVLDDCSQDSTSQIIKSFAHDGVRFIQGNQPSTSWLGKNHAYEHLLKNASGDIVLFSGVDVHFNQDSIQQIVGQMQSRSSKCLSIMSRRRRFDLVPTLFRSIRYYWELAFANWPHMNSCWAVDRQWLLDKGGFTSYKHNILPEREIANQARLENAYDFIISTSNFKVTTRKRLNSEFETASRTAYPRLHREPLWAILSSIFAISIASLMVLPLLLFNFDSLETIILLISCIYLWLSVIVVELTMQPKFWFLSGLFTPINWFSSALISLVSMVSYEFGRVDWKGRNVCLSVMVKKLG